MHRPSPGTSPAGKQAEETIRRASAYNRSLIEASLDPLVTINPDGTISDVNAATVKVTGFSREDLIGTDFSKYFTEPGRAKAGYEKVFRDGSVTDYGLEIRHRDGKITPVLYNATVFKDENGGIAGVFAAARDITERKKAEEAIRRAECIQPEPDRGKPRPARHDQPRRDDQRRERCDGTDHRRVAGGL